MDGLRRVPEAAMIAAFLRAEYDSDRFGDQLRRAAESLGLDHRALIQEADLANDIDNERRRRVLVAHREDPNVLTGLPEGLRWFSTAMTRAEVGRLRYVDYSYWNELSEGSSLVQVGARNVLAGRVVFDVPNDRFFKAARSFEAVERTEPIIIWGTAISAPLTLLEGHLRATAFVMSEASTVLPVIVGLTADPLAGAVVQSWSSGPA